MCSAFPKLFAPLSLLLACCVFLAAAGVRAQAADETPVREATLVYHFRPIVTWRTTLVGMTPEVRVRRALARINNLTPGQMTQPVERTPFTVDSGRGISVHIGETSLFTILQGDLAVDEKISLDEAAERAALEMAAALQASVEQRRPRVLLTGGGLSLLASALALGCLLYTSGLWHRLRARFAVGVQAHGRDAAPQPLVQGADADAAER